ncbi:MAG: hypothetical protein HWQ41_19305 [Nostoc sp. NOS(2021)]|uniref:hypothetical protein n=1 Tax=Nostoc sp. NOS(2021) TaxID=2815407 RepID=UPI0025F52431|nr:hypothetical protein [Nostoc sp. NOS(2021)]MBN3897343.1 hypothetical protein [Nostoc sp. NOS(2021)]
MPENSIQNQASYPQLKVVSISKNAPSREQPKYNKPHCIIPEQDINWALSQAKSIQTLWKECWISDRYGSRFVKLATTLKESAFRLARKVLYAAGLFEFKRDTSINDSRKTESWSVINLHGARRIKEFWAESIAATDSPIAATDSPIAATDSPIAAKNSRSICSETLENTGVSEPLSNSSGSSQELLKEVPEEEVMQELELVEQVPTLAQTFVEETTALILELRSRDTKKADRQALLHERCLRHHKQPKPDLGFKESFITTYNWRIDEQRFQRLQNLTEECKHSFFEKFENLYGIYRNNLPEIFDRIISIISSSAFSYQSD